MLSDDQFLVVLHLVDVIIISVDNSYCIISVPEVKRMLPFSSDSPSLLDFPILQLSLAGARMRTVCPGSPSFWMSR